MFNSDGKQFCTEKYTIQEPKSICCVYDTGKYKALKNCNQTVEMTL